MLRDPRPLWAALLFGLVLAAAGQARGAEPVSSAISTAAEASKVVCSTPCAIRSGYMTLAGGDVGFLMAFDAASAPVDGPVTPRECIYVAGPGTVAFDFGPKYEMYKTGLTLVFSTTGCFTKTAAAVAYFRVEKN